MILIKEEKSCCRFHNIVLHPEAKVVTKNRLAKNILTLGDKNLDPMAIKMK